MSTATGPDWEKLIHSAPSPLRVKAVTYRNKRWNSYTEPLLIACDDGHEYVVKSASSHDVGRSLCTEQIMGHIADTIGAPVPVVKLVAISPQFLELHESTKGLPAGIAHGSRFIKNLSPPRIDCPFSEVPQNRARYALLAMMYGLAGVFADRQFFYEEETNLVWSVDHGMFLKNFAGWSTHSLKTTPSATPDGPIVNGCKLTDTELREAAQFLSRLVDAAIAKAVASPDDTWTIIMEERIALAQYFKDRADSLAV